MCEFIMSYELTLPKIRMNFMTLPKDFPQSESSVVVLKMISY